MRLVADQTAVGLENNALTAELLKNERQERELEIGAEIQHQLLPRNCPTIQGVQLAAKCLTASHVGGDYYDFIPIQKGDRWSLVIGDVMGKGVPAGLIMTMTRGMLRAEVLNGHTPSKIMEHLNEIMYDDLEKSHRFVTMFYSEYDPKARVLTFSNAAHPPALLWRSKTQTVHDIDTLGPLIGLESGSKYDQDSIQLQPGDVVLYYTDGFTEAANQIGDRFDEENLRDCLQWACQNCISTNVGNNANNVVGNVVGKSNISSNPVSNNAENSRPQAILNYIFQKVQDFIGNGRSHTDDMTLIVLEVQND
jgi:sigma-B regulation protein RsbU (phosphoserine phosphatase)